MKRIAIAVALTLSVATMPASAQTPSEYAKALGESVACAILDEIVSLPVPLCVVASAEFTRNLYTATLSRKSLAYCGSGNFPSARYNFSDAPDLINDRKKCATILLVACKLHGSGC